jgi:hypothetical protein
MSLSYVGPMAQAQISHTRFSNSQIPSYHHTTMPNPHGINGHECLPSPEELTAILEETLEYRMTIDEQLEYLREKGIRMSKSSLKRVKDKMGMTQRTQWSKERQVLAILEQVERSIGQIGVGARIIQTLIKNKYEQRVSRKLILSVLKEVDPEGFIIRTPGSRLRVKRSAMFGIGPHAQWSCDGHDKLEHFNIQIYGIADNWSAFSLKMGIARSKKASIVARHYLDTALQVGGIPMTLITDR